MAEEHRIRPLTPGRIKREFVNPRNSIGPPKLGPNYLRASTGSCHDFCKFGKAQACEPKAKDFLRRKPVKKPTEDETLVKGADFLEKNPPAHRPTSSSDSHIHLPQAHDVVRQKDKNSDRRNLVRGDLATERKMNPATKTNPSSKPSAVSPAKKPNKIAFFSTNGTSKQALPICETLKQTRKASDTSKLVKKIGNTSKLVPKADDNSKQVQRINENLVAAPPKLKERSVAPVSSNSLSIRPLSSFNPPSLIIHQKRGEVKLQENSGTHKVMTKNLSVPSSTSPPSKPSINKKLVSPPSKPSINKKVTANNVFERTVVKGTTFDRASPMKSKDKAKDSKAVRAGNREKTIVNVEKVPNIEEMESDASKMVHDQSIDQGVNFNLQEMERKHVENTGNKCIMESTLVDVEEIEREFLEGTAIEGIEEGTLVDLEEMEIKPLEAALSEHIVEGTILNVEAESQPLEAVVSECNVERNIMQVGEIESKAEIKIIEVEEIESIPLEPVIDESTLVKVEEVEIKPLDAALNERIVEGTITNIEEAESGLLEAVVSECNVEKNIMQVGEMEIKAESIPLEPVFDESTIEDKSPPFPASIAESSSLSPCSSPSPLQDECQTESEYSVSEWEDYSASEYEEFDLKEGEASEEGDGKSRCRKGGSHRPENDEGMNPTKLQFRRGRIIDVQHENNTPRRLRFRRRAVLGKNQNQNVEFRMSDLKRRQIVCESNNDGTDYGSGKVFLRHSDIQEKKDTKGLFNNVIEETASKLVETRKSKVKALVGAFETVISLQDINPYADT
ncbi:hypothetical protein SAY87_003773 [Trapa incisa]|uniref:Calmodulin-binding domain-containing protein n=1 Tax=Trapa incisa TaxID=236973 RepID=A0AAN7QI45_9MYRT|nr:hypothetical protein SAY87_003773 [Trapa incisa]